MELQKEKCDYCHEMKEFILKSIESRRKLRICLECHTKAEQKEQTSSYGTHKSE